MRQLPWWAAPRAALRSPLTLLVAAGTALLACFLAAAAPLHASAAGGAAVRHQAETVCPDHYGPTFQAPAVPPERVPELVDAVTTAGARHGFDRPVVAMYTPLLTDVEFNGEGYRIRIGYRDGALDHLQRLAGDRAPGLWVGRDLAGFAGIELGTRGAQGRLPPVTGVYTDLRMPPPRWWCSQSDLAVQNILVDHIPSGPVLFATDRDTFTRLTAESAALERLHVAFAVDPPRTLAEAERNRDRAEAVRAAVATELDRRGLGDAFSAGVPFTRSVEIARQARDNVLLSILPLAAISVLVGCAGIGAVAAQWYQRRHAPLRLLAARGAGPTALGGFAVAELGLPLLAGGGAGTLLAWLLLPVYGPPGDPDPATARLAAGAALAVAAGALGLLFGVVALRARRDFELGRSGPDRPRLRRVLALLPWELVTAGGALLGWVRLREHGATGPTAAPLPPVDPLALTYPVFVVLTVGLLAARLGWLLLRVAHHARWWSRPALQLAVRRLAAARAPVTAVLMVGVLAVGTSAAGSGIAAGQRQALAQKSGAVVGAESRVDVGGAVGTYATPLPAPLRDTSTVVGQLTGTGSVVLVVDPATLARGAWLDTPAAGLAELVRALDHAPPGNGVPAIRVGHTAEQTTALPGLPDARPVADVPMFPTIGGAPGYVISRNALPAEQLAAVPVWRVLSAAPLAELTGELGAAGLVALNPMSRAAALDALPFYLVEWSFSFVRMLGALLGVVAVLALLVAVEVRRRQNALAGVLVLRMGMRPRTLLASHAAELGALTGLAVLTGLACGLTVAAIATPRFDPARWLAPRSALPDLTLFVVGVAVIAALVVAGAATLAVRSVRAARTAELLRD
ncbi:putative ABC transport system permease protein [Amycolatopsis arida]|uniref:Putative ABC transport system permease protein n=1 Tax=Amycolatopsis arida TaxID=587909 RepID=A0A1I5ZG54_9PSEU|nr:permease [Amycolatopsis arida]TDX89641.1 putative ABC transport system permease protein [Amycolatopsis arida]SFQ55353.1 putative ABC transport system permease protein [Amycolatopsis arida]